MVVLLETVGGGPVEPGCAPQPRGTAARNDREMPKRATTTETRSGGQGDQPRRFVKSPGWSPAASGRGLHDPFHFYGHRVSRSRPSPLSDRTAGGRWPSCGMGTSCGWFVEEQVPDKVPGMAWGDLIEQARRSLSDPNFENRERIYKLQIAEAIGHVLEMAERGEDWTRELRRTLGRTYGPSPPFTAHTRFSQHQWLHKLTGEPAEEARGVLAGMRGQGDPIEPICTDLVEPLDEHVDPGPRRGVFGIERRVGREGLEPLDDPHRVDDDLAVELGDRNQVLATQRTDLAAIRMVVIYPFDREALVGGGEGDTLDVGREGDPVDAQHAWEPPRPGARAPVGLRIASISAA